MLFALATASSSRRNVPRSLVVGIGVCPCSIYTTKYHKVCIRRPPSVIWLVVVCTASVPVGVWEASVAGRRKPATFMAKRLGSDPPPPSSYSLTLGEGPCLQAFLLLLRGGRGACGPPQREEEKRGGARAHPFP